MITISKRPSTSWTLSTPIRNQIIDTAIAEDMSTKFDDFVAHVRIADGTDGDFL